MGSLNSQCWKKSDNYILLQTCEKCDLLIEVVINETESAFRTYSTAGLFQAPRLWNKWNRRSQIGNVAVKSVKRGYHGGIHFK